VRLYLRRRTGYFLGDPGGNWLVLRRRYLVAWIQNGNEDHVQMLSLQKSHGKVDPKTFLETYGRFEFETSLSQETILTLAKSGKLRVLQTSSPVEPNTLAMLNDILFSLRPDVEFRIYGSGSWHTWDLTFLRQLPKLAQLAIDCRTRVTGTEALQALPELSRLSVGTSSFENFDFLQSLPTQQLVGLALSATQSKAPDLTVIERFQNLRTLYVQGKFRNLESVAKLTKVEDLTLRSVNFDDLSFLSRLQNLRSLDIKLGGIKSLRSLEDMQKLRYLELWQIKGLEEVDFISSLVGLQNLFLQSLRNVTRIPNLARLKKLRRVYLENMKGLEDLSTLATAPSLRELVHVASRNELADYESVLKMPSLKMASVGLGSLKKNDAFVAMAKRQGIDDYRYSEFVYVTD
jgi:hypothetical protein